MFLNGVEAREKNYNERVMFSVWELYFVDILHDCSTKQWNLNKALPNEVKPTVLVRMNSAFPLDIAASANGI